jgi:uncharacterized protein
MRKLVTISTVMGLVLALVLSGCGASKGTQGAAGPAPAAGEQKKAEADPKQLSLGAGSQGGVYYPIGVGVATVISKYVTTTSVTPEVTGAASDNLVLLGNGEIGIGITTAGDLYKGARGEAPYDKKYTNISVMFGGVKPGAVQIVVPKNSNVQSVADLKGKRVGVGPQGGSGWTAFAELLPYFGLKWEDIKPSYISYDESIDQMKDGNLDASVIVAGLPTPAVNSLAVQAPYRMLTLPKEKLDTFLKEHPYYIPVTVKQATYPKLDQDVATYATVNLVAVRDSLSEDLVYRMTQATFDHLDELQNVHASAKAITLESAISFTGYRYHPGAAKYFKEKGKEVPTK